MTSKKLYWLFIGLIGLLFIGLVAGTYGVNSLLSKQSNSVTALKAKSLALAQEQITLKKAKADIQTYANLETIAKEVVPQDKDQAEAVREIVNIADTNGVALSAINFPASSLGNGIIGAKTPTATSSSPSTPSANTSQLQPVPGISGVYQLPITVISDTNKPVAYDKFISFLTALEHNRRTAQVSSITIQPSNTNHSLLTFTLNLNEYIKP